MTIFSKIDKPNKETRLIFKKPKPENAVISVPDIKEYLVKEYERVQELKLLNEGLEQKIEMAEEIKLKYDATLVTLDEYSKRLERAERNAKSYQGRIDTLRQELKSARDEVNSYKIKFNNIAITKEEITKEIVEETKLGLISAINNCKGNLSKKIVCEIINSYKG